jgi:membrane protein YdbS with pleckstrin-like domain
MSEPDETSAAPDAPAPVPPPAPQPPSPAITTPAPALPAEWRALPPAAATTAMYGGSALGLLLGAGGCFFVGWPLLTAGNLLDLPWWQGLMLMVPLWLLFGVAGAWFAYRRWKFSAWKLDGTGLHFRRGRAWRKEVLVPRSRVQHLDIERGPIERRYGLATLIVHTAGTRQHALRVSGLEDADAVALRDALVPDPGHHDDVL